MLGWEKSKQQVSSGEGFGGFYTFQKLSSFLHYFGGNAFRQREMSGSYFVGQNLNLSKQLVLHGCTQELVAPRNSADLRITIPASSKIKASWHF